MAEFIKRKVSFLGVLLLYCVNTLYHKHVSPNVISFGSQEDGEFEDDSEFDE